MITQKSVAYGAWTVLSVAGESGSCWLDEDRDGSAGSADVRIVHSDAGEPALTEATKGKRIYRPSGNDDVCIISADNALDIYYATCMNAGGAAIISVDMS